MTHARPSSQLWGEAKTSSLAALRTTGIVHAVRSRIHTARPAETGRQHVLDLPAGHPCDTVGVEDIPDARPRHRRS